MKKSRIAKLALMGASITALAATLTTSTYAWYVSNKTANVKPVSGATDSAAGDGSISLSTSGVYSEYYKTISLDAAANYNGVDTNVKLAPVTTANGTSFIKDDGKAAATTAYYKYEFYVKAEKACTIIPTITITNTTETAPTQINYSTAASNPVTGEAEKGKAFTIDATKAMYMSQSTVIGDPYTGTNADQAFKAASLQTGAITGQANAIVDGAKFVVNGSSAISSYANVATGGAHAYYEEIMGTAPAYVEKDLYTKTATAIGNITLAANTPQKVTYYLWLDGADDQCFNCCAGQDFTVAFSYTVQAQQKQ